MSKLPGDPNLPPGCTHRDIERTSGDEDTSYCIRCDEWSYEGLNDVGLCVGCVLAEEQQREAEFEEARLLPELRYNEEREATLREIDLILSEAGRG